MNTKVLSFLNQKGGVGKSTILFHFAHYLHEKGKKVLVCDLDTQGNASSVFLGDDYREEFSKYLGTGWLLGIDKDATEIPVSGKGISVLHADSDLFDVEELELDYVVASIRARVKQFSDFDYILIDCPPTIGKRVFGALYASTNVVSPIEPRKFSIDGIESLMESILAVQDDYPELSFEGVIINRVNSRSHKQKENINIIREALGKSVFLTELVERESISDAIENKMPVWSMGRTGAVRAASKEIKQLLLEIERSVS